MGLLNSRFILSIPAMLSALIANAQGYDSTRIKINLFPDSASHLNTVSVTIGNQENISASDQALLHLFEHCIQNAEIPAFGPESFRERANANGTRIFSDLRHGSLTLVLSSENNEAIPLLNNLCDVIWKSEFDEGEVKKQIKKIAEENDQRFNNPEEVLAIEANKYFCEQLSDCMDGFPAQVKPPGDETGMLRKFMGAILFEEKFCISVSGRFDENAFISQVNAIFDSIPFSKGFNSMGKSIVATPRHSRLFSIINENVSLPEMLISILIPNHINAREEITGKIVASLISQKLQNEIGAIGFERAVAGFSSEGDYSLFNLWATPQLMRIKGIADSLNFHLSNLFHTDSTDLAFLQTAKTNVLAKYFFDREGSPENLIAISGEWARRSSDNKKSGADPDSKIPSGNFQLPGFKELLESCTFGDIKQFIKKYILAKPFIAGITITSVMDAISGAEESFVSADAKLQDDEPENRIKRQKEIAGIRIFFQSNSNLPDVSSSIQLEKLTTWLNSNPNLRLFINGYTDSQGDGAKNYQLSLKRAIAVREILMVTSGINKNRLIIRPWGEAFPEFPETNAENIRKNRRVTFEVADPNAVPDEF